ncbi:MAG: hypothetical protein EOP11_02850 [Proteobacteria bacterium]|nr:MAG: hypothetical protein EOP11_02850 [Pseudomonadota bacterium]
MKILPLLLLSALTSISAQAAAVHSCEGLDSVGNLVGNVRSYAQGAIRVAYVSTEEPAAAPDHILVFVADNEMGQTCYAVSASKDGMGFAGVEMPAIKSDYDAAKGLLVTIPVSKYDPDTGAVPGGEVKIRINRTKAEGKQVSLE